MISDLTCGWVDMTGVRGNGIDLRVPNLHPIRYRLTGTRNLKNK